jgi:hypothetical protein
MVVKGTNFFKANTTWRALFLLSFLIAIKPEGGGILRGLTKINEMLYEKS